MIFPFGRLSTQALHKTTCVQVDHSMYQPMDDEVSLRGHGHVT